MSGVEKDSPPDDLPNDNQDDLLRERDFSRARGLDVSSFLVQDSNDEEPEKVAEVLGLPHRVYCVFGMCLGYPAEAPVQKPRMNFEAMVHLERYDADKMQAHVADYDAALGDHYRSQGRPTNEASWSHDVATKFAARPRDTLRDTLKSMGFDFV